MTPQYASIRLKMPLSSDVKSAGNIVGKIVESEDSKKVIHIDYDGFNHRWDLVAIDMEDDTKRVLLSNGETREVEIDSYQEWEYNNEVYVYGRKINGDNNYVTIVGGVNAHVEITGINSIDITVGSANVSIWYEDYYGWSIDAATTGGEVIEKYGSGSRKAKRFAPESEVVRIGFDDNIQKVCVGKGAKLYDIHSI